jgi:hypothetical protein
MASAKKRHRVVAQVYQFKGQVAALLGDAVDPVRGLVAEAAFAGGADDDADAGDGCAHEVFLKRERLRRKAGVQKIRAARID